MKDHRTMNPKGTNQFQPDSQQEKPKKKHGCFAVLFVLVGTILLAAIIIVFIQSAIDADNQSSYSTSPSNAPANTSSVTTDPSAAQKNKEEFIKDCETYTYKEIARNPSNYVGKKAKFEGQVIQIMEHGNDVIMRVDITKEENEFASGGYLYTDTVYVEYTRKSETESRILEDDVIMMYGTLNGTKTYDTVLGSDTTIPYFLAEYIDILSE